MFWNSIHVCFEHFLFKCQNFLSDGRETFVNIAQEFKSVGISGIYFFVSPRSTVCFTVLLIFISQRRKAQSSSHIFCSLQCCCLKNMVFQTQNPFCNTLWGAEAISVFTASYEPKAWHERHGVLEQIIINTYM